MPNSKETVLIVDDESSVRELAAEVLETAGYRVLDASSGPEALAISAAHECKIDLLLTDLIMPGMTGRMLADILSARCAGLEVIFMSGYIDDTRTTAMVQGLNFIPKPLDWNKLKKMIKDLMEQKKKRP